MAFLTPSTLALKALEGTLSLKVSSSCCREDVRIIMSISVD